MYFSQNFFRAAGICSILSAVSTLLLIFIPECYTPPSNFDEQVALHTNPYYIGRLWIHILHPVLVLTAAFGVVARKHAASTGSAVLGFLFFTLWGFTEIIQQSLNLFANNYTWRAAYAAATDNATRTLLKTQIIGFEAIWDGLFFALLLGFFLSNVSYGIATYQGKGLEKIVSICFFAGAGLTALSLIGNYGGPQLMAGFMSFLYPFI
ncbi:hypothetical protein GXP67_15480 [Rhodocytophaga rosea]|uniref:DUF4386 domain-containing protein n=1 Tax=Rhodocytophaga rosea TaxID=2704465 RepID=A0A6C0GJY0_9BACT|nr:hypothetical protein [Rhodocytophaga rosea]QHT67940.1 hypothetical protein GXP67_15480 [Rhodocytophaga rosea]